MVIYGVLFSEPSQGVDSAHPNGQSIVTEHLRAPLVLLVQQSLLSCRRLVLGCVDLSLRSIGLTFCHPSSPTCEYESQRSTDKKPNVSKRLAV